MPVNPVMANKQILFLVQYPENVSPSQRFRFELYKNVLAQNGFTVTTQSFIDDAGYAVIFKEGFFFQKSFAVLKGFLRRVKLLFSVKKYDFILLECGAAPIGPPVFEWVMIKLLKKKIVYDFDGSIWVPQVSDMNRLYGFLKTPGKVAAICRWAYSVSCGNDFLCKYAKQYNTNVVYNPTCVDTENHHNILAKHDVDRITIGWTGSFSTLPYLKLVEPVLQKLQTKYDFEFKIICNQKPTLNLKNVQYVEWSAENEVKELANCQIGLMPLTHDEWSEGKCGFKLIQYLSLEIPAVASPVGVNKKIVEDGVNGFLCDTEDEWYKAVEKLLQDADLRKQMGSEGRKKMIKDYSLTSNKENFLSIFS
jgi:glycosyltransferase involved in cell wall biosynthesis